jgi:hypothetical protein
MLLRLACLISISTFLCTGQENTQIPSTNPELIEGPWETTGASGIDGIFLTIETGSNWQTINIRVYHRDAGKEISGNFGTNEKAAAQSYNTHDGRSFTLFDGNHLRIHFVDVVEMKSFDLDLTSQRVLTNGRVHGPAPVWLLTWCCDDPNRSPVSLRTHLWVIGRPRPANPISRPAASTFGSRATEHFLHG